MNRRRVLRTLAGAAVVGSGITRGSLTESASTGCSYRNPVFDRFVVPDPTVLRAGDGRYYAAGTYNVWGDDDDRPLVPVLRSRNLVDWTYVGPAFRERPSWKRGGVWAPELAYRNGRYLLYYSLARWHDPNPGIGLAVAETPAGPYADRGPVLRSDAVGVENSIDPFHLVADGTPYLFWGSHRGIYAAELESHGRCLAGEPTRVAGEGIEAAAVIERDGRYYLFVSTGTCCEGAESTYRVIVGRASTPEGPYRDAAGDVLAAGRGELVVRGGKRLLAPGHADVVRDDAGDAWLLHHVYERDRPWVGETPRRVLALSRLAWSDGWPVVPGRRPSDGAPCPAVDDGD